MTDRPSAQKHDATRRAALRLGYKHTAVGGRPQDTYLTETQTLYHLRGVGLAAACFVSLLTLLVPNRGVWFVYDLKPHSFIGNLRF